LIEGRANTARAVRGVALGLLLSASGTALAVAVDPAELLVQISDASRKANYQGVIVYQTSGGRQETLRVTHAHGDNGAIERVSTLDGAPMEIIKQGGKVICLLPRDRKVTLEQPTPQALFPSLTPERVAQMVAFYKFESMDSDRVAGRNCQGVMITPRDRFRYGYQIWADEKTQVPLKVNLLAPNGAVLEQMFFTQVEFPEVIPESAFKIDVDPEKYRQITRLERPPASSEMPPGAAAEAHLHNMPPGYRITMREVRPTADGQGWVEHLVLSDGLSAISVFRARRPHPSFEGQSQIGAVHVFGRTVGRVHITVVGEAPSEAVQMIGQNVADGDDADTASSSQVAAPAASSPTREGVTP
jgi:sigma-E factor negative regulatory protein RseB